MGIRMNVIRVESVNKQIGKTRILRNVSFVVNKGDIFSLIGPNGSGKTSIIKIIIGVWAPSSGKSEILGIGSRNLVKSESDIVAQIGIAPQTIELWNYLKVEETLYYLGEFYGLSKKTLRDRVIDLLEKFGLVDHSSKLVVSLSEGLKKRLQLAAAFINDPVLVILDEPTESIDPEGKLFFSIFIRKFAREGGTVLIATQDLMIAQEISTRVAIMNKGKIIDIASPDEILKKYCDNKILIVTLESGVLDEGIKILKKKFDVPIYHIGNNLFIPLKERLVEKSNIIKVISEELKVRTIIIRNPTLIDAYQIAVCKNGDKTSFSNAD